MNWKQYWNELARTHDPLQQVARTGGKGAITEGVLDEIAQRIATLLELQPTDHLLDVCCGNGQLSKRLLPHCEQITGVDISEGQIAHAKALNEAKIDFRVGDATRLQEVVAERYDHVLLYFSFQYLETPAKAIAALHQMRDLLKPGGHILLGDVPEREKLSVFYPQRQDRIRYELKRRWGRSLMGRFWSLRELQAFAAPLGMTVKRLEQPDHFPYAHYRADFLLTERGNE